MQNEENSPHQPDFLTAPELAAKLNVSLKSIVNWTQARRLPIIKMGRINRYPWQEIQKRLLSGNLLFEGHSGAKKGNSGYEKH
jgi:hypothetical protein